MAVASGRAPFAARVADYERQRDEVLTVRRHDIISRRPPRRACTPTTTAAGQSAPPTQPAVVATRARFDDLSAQLAEWRALVEQLRAFSAHVAAGARAPLKLLADVGEGCHVQARVHDASRVCVDVGAGVFPELSLEEAAAFAGAKVRGLERLQATARQELVGILADVELVDLGIRALRGEAGDANG